MTLDEAETTARSIVAVQEKYGVEFPSEMAAGVLARALLAILPVVKAAEAWRAANPGSPKWAAKSWRLRDAIDQLRREMEE